MSFCYTIPGGQRGERAFHPSETHSCAVFQDPDYTSLEPDDIIVSKYWARIEKER